MTEIFGTCDSAFKAVRDVFAGTFAAAEPYRNIGASLCVYRHGRCVIELHGGSAGPLWPWSSDTLVNIWSRPRA